MSRAKVMLGAPELSKLAAGETVTVRIGETLLDITFSAMARHACTVQQIQSTAFEDQLAKMMKNV